MRLRLCKITAVVAYTAIIAPMGFRASEFETRNSNLGNSYVSVLQACTAPPAGMVSWWPGDLNANDIRGGNHGTLVGGAAFALGKVGPGFSLDGADDFVQILDSASLSVSTAISIDAWIAPDTVSHGYILSKYDSSVNQASYAFKLLSGNILFIVYEIGDRSVFRGVITNAAVVSVGSFSHVAATFDTATQEIQIYVNGVVVPSTLVLGSSSVIAIFDSTTPVRIGTIIGTAGGYEELFDGIIDEASLYQRALSESEIQAIFNAGNAGKCKFNVYIPLVQKQD